MAPALTSSPPAEFLSIPTRRLARLPPSLAAMAFVGGATPQRGPLAPARGRVSATIMATPPPSAPPPSVGGAAVVGRARFLRLAAVAAATAAAAATTATGVPSPAAAASLGDIISRVMDPEVESDEDAVEAIVAAAAAAGKPLSAKEVEAVTEEFAERRRKQREPKTKYLGGTL